LQVIDRVAETFFFLGGTKLNTRVLSLAAILAAILVAASAHAELSPTELAKIAQNPIGNLISVPFQENYFLNTGPLSGSYSLLNIQPIIPVSVNSDWNIITRTILPVVSLPSLAPDQSRTDGIGDTQISAFLSPANPGEWIWGVGAITQLPTHSNPLLGNNNTGFGPTFLVLHLAHDNPWVVGLLVNNVWSSNNSTAPAYNNGLVEPFANYNFKGGLYAFSAPEITVNWDAKGPNQWTVPMGGGVGKIFHFGRLPVNTQVGAFYNVVRPEFAPNWNLRFQVQLMFPK
jgi:hypothetical protein